MDRLILLMSLFAVLPSYGGSAMSVTNSDPCPIPVQLAPLAKERLKAFGFGQAILINNATATSRADVALSTPNISNRETAKCYFSSNAVMGSVAAAYLTAPLTADFNQPLTGGYGNTIGNFNDYLLAVGLPVIDQSDKSSVFKNNLDFNFISLSRDATRSKMVALLNRIMEDVPSTAGFFIDHIEPSANFPVSFSYPQDFHSVISLFKANRLAQAKEEPIIMGNFYSLRQHAETKYGVFNPNVFDAVLVEEYRVRSGSDQTPEDVLNFHKVNPETVIVVNTMVVDSANPTVEEQARAREAVTIAALSGGLHAIDGGVSAHGDNAFAARYLSFPNLRPGKPITKLDDQPEYYRRDYTGMIALYAKTATMISIPTGTWRDFWNNTSGSASFAVGSVQLVAGQSALLFRVASATRLVNLSTRGQVLTGDNVMIGGFVVGGSTPKKVLIRAVGPTLANYGVTGVLADPTLQLFSGPTAIASNDDWGSASNAAEIQASGLAPNNTKESAILTTLNPGAYTAIVSGVGGGTGVGIVEVFELDNPDVPFVNISTRGQVLTGDNVMIGGFVIQGDSSKTVLIRAVGPNLANYGVTGVLANPTLQLFSGSTVIASNDDWGSAANASAITATGLAPVSPLESAILITLQPGAYTAIVSGAGGGTGVGIVEVFAQ